MHVCVWLPYARRAANHSLTWSNSSRSTSPSPFRSNILKAISKFLWGAGHHRTQKQNRKSIQNNMKTTCHTGSTQQLKSSILTRSVRIKCATAFFLPPSGATWGALDVHFWTSCHQTAQWAATTVPAMFIWANLKYTFCINDIL